MDHLLRGRDALLDELLFLTRSGGHTVVLHGAGGFGKTAVALTLARRVERALHVWWVDASTARVLADDLREVALRAGAARSAVRRAWKGERSAPDLLWSTLHEMAEPWLLVVDNADDIAVLAAGDNDVRTGRGWIRTPPQLGTVVITSRDGSAESWGRRATIRHTRALNRHDGAAILRELAPHAGNRRQAVHLADALDGVPLALYLTGRYLNSAATSPRLPGVDRPRTFDDYRAALRDHFGNAITVVASSVDDPRQESLESTWERSLDLLHDRGHPLARPLLRLLATLAPVPIPCLLLDATVLARTSLFADLDPDRLVTTLTALIGLGLVDLHRGRHHGPDTVALHPLVRAITRQHPEVLAREHDYSDARLALLHLVTTHTDTTDTSTWPLWRALLPHCEHETNSVRAPSRRRGVLADIHHNAAGFAYEHGFHITAEDLYRRALDARLATLGSKHPDSLATRHNLAVLLAEHGDHDAARRSFEDILADCSTALGTEHPDTLNTRRQLACAHRDLGHHDIAEAELRKIVGIQEKILGTTHPDTIMTRYEIAVALHHRGRFGGAASLLHDLLQDQRHVLGDHHAHTLITKHLLVRLAGVGNVVLDGADLRRVTILAISSLGSEHPVTLNARNSFAVAVHEARRDLAEAELRRIAKLQTEQLGPRHAETLATRHNLDVIGRRASLVPLAAEDDRAASVRTPLRRSSNSDPGLGHRRDRVRVLDLSTVVTGENDVHVVAPRDHPGGFTTEVRRGETPEHEDSGRTGE